MAKRRTLEVPTAEALRALEDGFRTGGAEGRSPGARPPIADVVADAAARSSLAPVQDREEAARNKVQAQTYRDALNRGLVAHDLSIHDIAADALTRDRVALDEDEQRELVASIRSHGLRLPIEVFEVASAEGTERYGLISGYRRLAAFRHLNAVSGGQDCARIPAFVRQPETAADGVIAMVEENEIRSGLSHYERGRAAASALHQGIFASLDEAVGQMFGSASKAKRSKVRSFALIHEELGDVLTHAVALTEKQGLRLAAALRAGFAAKLRDALEAAEPRSAADEMATLERAIAETETGTSPARRPGRPRNGAPRMGQAVTLGPGITARREETAEGFAIRLSGEGVDEGLVDAAIGELGRLFGAR